LDAPATAALRRSSIFRSAVRAAYIGAAVVTGTKNAKELRALLREAERDLDAARRRTELNEAARKLMQAKAALKRLEQKAMA